MHTNIQNRFIAKESVNQIFKMKNPNLRLEMEILYYQQTDCKSVSSCNLIIYLKANEKELPNSRTHYEVLRTSAIVCADDCAPESLTIRVWTEAGISLFFRGICISGIDSSETDNLFDFIKQMYGVKIKCENRNLNIYPIEQCPIVSSLTIPFPQTPEQISD